MQFSGCSISHKTILFVVKAVSYRLMILHGHFLRGKIKESFTKMTLSKTENILINMHSFPNLLCQIPKQQKIMKSEEQ
jgi:hypothetical protein